MWGAHWVSRISLRVVSLVVLIAMLLVVATACEGSGSAENLPRGGQLRWSIDGVNEIATLDPALAGEQQSVMVIKLIYAGLVRLDDNLEVQPDGAERWDVSEEGKTYTFHLRDGLAFADGTPVTAEDFVYSLTRALSPETGAYSAPSQFRHIVGATELTNGTTNVLSGVRAVDERTLEIKLDEPIAYFLSLLTQTNAFAVPRSLIETHGEAWMDHAYGTGPFRLKEWRHREGLLLEANPNYWRGMPGIDTIWMPFHQDSNESLRAYLGGELDIMGNPQAGIPASRVADVKELPDFRTSPALAVRYVGFNNRLAPFDNDYVRQAFARAADRLLLAEQTLAGTVEPTNRILPQGLAGSKFPVQGQTFDPDDTRAALRLAGYLSGQDLPPITLTYANEGDNEAVARTLQKFWRDTIGIDVTLQGVDLSTFSNRLDETYNNPERGLQMYLSVWGADYPDPHNFLSQQLRTGSPNNNGHWSNAEFDALVDKADKMGGFDQREERLRLYNEAEQIALTEVGWMPLYNPRINVMVRPEVHGLTFTPKDLIASNWTKVRIEQEEGGEQ